MPLITLRFVCSANICYPADINIGLNNHSHHFAYHDHYAHYASYLREMDDCSQSRSW